MIILEASYEAMFPDLSSECIRLHPRSRLWLDASPRFEYLLAVIPKGCMTNSKQTLEPLSAYRTILFSRTALLFIFHDTHLSFHNFRFMYNFNLPMITEDRIIDHDLLEKLDQLVG